MSADDEEIIEVLGNKYNPEILDAAGEPKSAQELSDQLGVPIATCYRRINELEDTELLELHDRPLSVDAPPVHLDPAVLVGERAVV